jgi:glycosyltransferase involved in cell wall biosynthesis
MTQEFNHFSSVTYKKILYVKGGYAVEEGDRLVKQRGKVLKGGPDQFFLAVLSIIPKDAFIRVVTFGREGRSKKIDRIELIEYSIRKVTQSKFLKSLYYGSVLLKFIISSLIYRPKVILCGMDGPIGIAALISAKLSGIKFIFSAHNDLHGPQVSNLYKILNKYLVTLSDQIIVHGEFLADQVLSYGVSKNKFFSYASSPDEAELDLINDLKNQQVKRGDGQTKKKTILFVGRMEEDKGIFDLLDAFCLAKLDNTELLYIGDGSLLTNIRELVLKKNIQNVQFLGQISHVEVYEKLSSATVLIAPTRSKFPEGRCMSVEEALITGIPVIAPNYGAFPYLVSHQVNGLLYQSDSVEELSKAIVKVIKNPDLLMLFKEGALNSGKSLLESRTFRDALLDTFIVEET